MKTIISKRYTKQIKIENAFVINPFLAYSLFWCISLILYQFSPSELNIPLNVQLTLFLVFTIVVSALFAVYFNYKMQGLCIRVTYRKASCILLSILVVAYICEFIYSANVPLLNILLNSSSDNSGGYLEFGIPFFHVLIVVFNSFYCIYNGWLYLVFKKKNNFFAFLITAAYYLLCYSRGLLLFNIIVIILLFVSCKKLPIKTWVMLFIAALIGMWLFGVLGNLRSGGDWNDTGYFMAVSHISGNRYSLFAPFYWVEEYFVCSLRNLNYNTLFPVEYDISGLISSLLPDAIAKRVFPDVEYTINLVSENLNTSTSYIFSYVAFGVVGMLISFFCYMAIALIFTKITFLQPEFKIISIAMLFFLFALTIFDNMIFYSGYSFSIIVAIVFSWGVNIIRIHKRKLYFIIKTKRRCQHR